MYIVRVCVCVRNLTMSLYDSTTQQFQYENSKPIIIQNITFRYNDRLHVIFKPCNHVTHTTALHCFKLKSWAVWHNVLFAVMFKRDDGRFGQNKMSSLSSFAGIRLVRLALSPTHRHIHMAIVCFHIKYEYVKKLLRIRTWLAVAEQITLP